MNKKWKKAILAGAAICVAVAGFLIIRSFLAGSGAIQFVTSPVAYADISTTVSETGIVNPVTQVTVGSEVSGTVRSLNVDFNSKVTQGQILATLDPTTFQASVDSAQANLRLQQANADSAAVNVEKMKAQYDMANLTMQRDEPLLQQGLIDLNQMDTERTAAKTALQDYFAAQAQVRVAAAQISVVRGQVATAQYNLSKTIIKSPINGTVMQRNVNIGQTVAASLQTPTLFTIATNLTDMQVDTSVDEADVGSLLQGQPAKISVTAFPNAVFEGTVLQVRINPTTVQNVVTYDAVVQVHDKTGRLFPGMTAQVVIRVAMVSHVLTIPLAAILYRPLPAAGSKTAATGSGGGNRNGAAAQPIAGAPGSPVTIWKLVDGKAESLSIVIGLSDGKNIEIKSGNVVENDLIIVSQKRQGAKSSGSAAVANAPGPGK